MHRRRQRPQVHGDVLGLHDHLPVRVEIADLLDGPACYRLLEGVESEHPLVVEDLGPVVGTHTGPGTVGLCFVTAD